MNRSGAQRIDLDDSKVLCIKRNGDHLKIELEQFRGGAPKVLTVCVSRVVREVAEFYVGHNITAPHPDPSSPLDWVEYAEQGQRGVMRRDGRGLPAD